MHQFFFGYELTDQDCLDLQIKQEYINVGIQSQIHFVIVFKTFSGFEESIERTLERTFKIQPEFIYCNFRREPVFVAIVWL